MRYSSTLSLILALDGGGWLMPHPTRFTPGKETRYPSSRRLGEPQSWFGWVQKISTPTWIWTPDCPACSKLLYWPQCSISLCGILNSTTATPLLSIYLGETTGFSSCHAGRLPAVSWYLTCYSHFPQTRTWLKGGITHGIVTKLFWAFHLFPIRFSSLKWSLPQMTCSFKQVIRKSQITANIYIHTIISTRWETTQRIIIAKLTKLNWKIVILRYLVAESCTTCLPWSWRQVQ